MSFKMHKKYSIAREFAVILGILFCSPSPGEAFFSWDSISPALERAASYGYSMLGYAPQNYGYGDDIELYEKKPIWDGHVNVGELLSPVLKALSSTYNTYTTDMYGNAHQDRVVKGFDNRFGFRLAVPHFGDFQVTREYGPGKFLDKLGPGEYPYAHLPKSSGLFGKGSAGHGYGGHVPKKPQYPVKVIYKEPAPAPADMYQGLQNYPWYKK